MESKQSDNERLAPAGGSDAELKAAIRIVEETDAMCSKEPSELKRLKIIIKNMKRANALLDAALKHPNVRMSDRQS